MISCLCFSSNAASNNAISAVTSFFFFLSPFGTPCLRDWILPDKKYQSQGFLLLLQLFAWWQGAQTCINLNNNIDNEFYWIDVMLPDHLLYLTKNYIILITIITLTKLYWKTWKVINLFVFSLFCCCCLQLMQVIQLKGEEDETDQHRRITVTNTVSESKYEGCESGSSKET